MTRRMTLILTVVTVFALSALTILFIYGSSVRANRSSPRAMIDTTESPAPSIQSSQKERGPVRMVRFTLYEGGIFPRTLRVQAGLINLALEDQTKASTGLIVERITGNERARVSTVQRFDNHWRGKQLIKLTPGQYRVIDATRPEYQAELIVEP